MFPAVKRKDVSEISRFGEVGERVTGGCGSVDERVTDNGKTERSGRLDDRGQAPSSLVSNVQQGTQAVETQRPDRLEWCSLR